MGWNYKFLEEKAEEMEAILPVLLGNNDWSSIEEIITSIPRDVWNGKGTETFYICCEKIVANKDENKVINIPATIRYLCTEKRKSDEALAERIDGSFRSFY